MRIIKEKALSDLLSKLSKEANFLLRKDVLGALKKALKKESAARSKEILKAIIDNAAVARRESLAICQDTGLPVVFLEIGNNVKVKGDIKKAVNKGVESGYRKYSLRNSVVRNPLKRDSSEFSPCVLHIDMVKGDKLKVTLLPKGFGCENKSQLKMFNPTASLKDIEAFIVEAVKNAGPDACPPYIIGVGIGGSADYACLLAKKALLEKVSSGRPKLEESILKKINALNIGPMGLGGRTTALGVNIKTYPTHIAGLPVAVNISCHALRSASAIL